MSDECPFKVGDVVYVKDGKDCGWTGLMQVVGSWDGGLYVSVRHPKFGVESFLWQYVELAGGPW